MAPLVGTLLVVLAVFILWIVSRTGRAALGFCLAHPVLFLPAIAVWGVVWGLDAIDARVLSANLFDLPLPGVQLAPSARTVLQIAAHIVAVSALLAWAIARLRPSSGATLGTVVGPVALVLAGVWVTMFAMLVALLLLAAALGKLAIWIMVAIIGLLFIAVNLLAAAMAGALPFRIGTLPRVAKERTAFLWAGGWRALARPVFVQALVIGLVTLVWLSGYTTTERVQKGMSTTTRTTSTSTFLLVVHTQCVLDLTTGNAWPEAICEATNGRWPGWVGALVSLFTAVASSVFVVAYVRGAPAAAAREEPWAGSSATR